MAERDPANNGDLPQSAEPSRADATLLGVAPPRIDSTPDSALRRPVFVRAGTSVADVEPPPVPHMALPSRAGLGSSGGVSDTVGVDGRDGFVERSQRALRSKPILWMVGAPVLLATFVVGILAVTSTAPEVGAAQAPSVPSSAAAALTSAQPKPAAATPKAAGAPELEGRPAQSLSSAELVTLSQARSERKVSAAQALRRKIEDNPQLAADKAIQAELFKLAADAETARDALAAMALAPSPVAADLLYEVWTSTPSRTEATELAHALVYSTDVRPKASPALAIALDLRSAEQCEQFKAALPNAAKEGDRRALHLLTKLASRRGCGPKKAADCFACLRADQDELVAAINATKARRPPSYPTLPHAK